MGTMAQGPAGEAVFRGARVDADGPLVDLVVRGGRFASVGPGAGGSQAAEVVDLGGRVVLPGFVESHIHLDKAFLEERRPNLSGTLEDAIAITLDLKRSVTKEEIRLRSERALRLVVRHGTTWVRAHVEVDPIVGLKGMEAALELRQACRDLADLQLVVFPQEGIEQQPGTRELMREAMRMGGDLVGGVPYNDLDAERHLDIVFDMAAEFGCGVDLHVDFSDNPEDRRIESIARRTISAGLQGRVAVGHLTSLGSTDDATAARIIEAIAEAGITVMPLPATDLFLGGRGPVPPRFRGLTRVKELLRAGVNVAIASNNIRNAFTPSGNGDLLEIGLLLACTAHMSGSSDRAVIPSLFTTHAARALGIEHLYGLAPGRAADFVVLDTENFPDVIIDQPEKRYVVKRGRVVVENLRETRWRAEGRGEGGRTMGVIEEANREALGRIFEAEPVLIDVRPAGEAIEGLAEGLLLHAGPPISWERMCGPLRGAAAGAAVLEGWAGDLEAAERLAASGGIAFHPNHHFGAVGPMTGVTTRSMPVMVVENRRFGNRAYCTLNEGLGKVMRFGGNDDEVLERLRWLADALGPALSAALRSRGGVPLKGIVARGLSMGDEMHQRNVACSGLFLREVAPALARTVGDAEQLGAVLEFIGGNDQFFLNVAMAVGKAIMDPVGGVEGSTIVTAMSRNGTDFGVRVGGTGEAWFTAPVGMPKGLYFPGFGEEDANPDMGDSAIVETMGLGGFAMAAAPAVAGFVGAGSAADALNYTRTMYEITAGQNPDWTLPALDFAGAPTGIDIRKVVETGIAPVINTGIAHREPGVGQVGAGVVRAPMACFEGALEAFAARMGVA